MSASRLKKEQRGSWLTVDAGTVRNIRHADALAVWILLLNCPDDWMVRRRWLQSELGIGSIRLRGAITHLEALGLWERRTIRDEESGRLGGTEIVIREVPAMPPSVQVPRHSVNRECRGKSSVEKSTAYQETDALPRDENNNKGCGDRRDAPENQTPVVVPDFVADADRLAVAAILATLATSHQQDVVTVLSSRLATTGEPIRDVPAFCSELARRARDGTLTLPANVHQDRQSAELETQKSAILSAVAGGDAVFLDGNPAELELDKFVRTAACTVPLAGAITAGRITTQQQGAQHENQ